MVSPHGFLTHSDAPAPIAKVLWACDRVRTRLLLALRPLSGRLAAHREARVAVFGIMLVIMATVGALWVPLWMLALGPIVLGVPHLLADVRYCVVRPGHHRNRALWVGAGLPMLALMFGADLGVGLAAVAGTLVAVGTSRFRIALGLALAAVAVAATTAWPRFSAVVAMHGHNLVAIVLWLAWRKRATRLHYWVVGAIGLGAALVCLAPIGSIEAVGSAAHAPAPGLTMQAHLSSLTGGLDGTFGVRLVLLFCFLQTVHYGIWLRLVPEEDRERATPRTFRASWEQLEREFGPRALRLVLVVMVALAAAALFDLRYARAEYLRFARFHLVLELCALAALWSTVHPNLRKTS